MRSIKSHIVRRLLIGQGVLWLIAATAVWHSQRSRLYSDYDNDLKFLAAAFRFHVRNESLETEVKNRWPKFLTGEDGWHYQAWNAKNESQIRSKGLGVNELPFSGAGEEWTEAEKIAEYRTFNFYGPEDEPLRGVATIARSLRFGRSRMVQVKSVLVTRSRRELDEKLAWLACFVFVASVGASIATARLVQYSVERGLLSLIQMSDKAGSIDVSNLDVRFEESEIPIELQPISKRLNDLMHRIELGFGRERRFSSDLAHEMRTPIAGLKSMAEMLLKWPEETSKERHLQILEMASQMEGIVESLLLLASWESAKSPDLRSEPVKVCRVVKQCWENEKNLALEKKLSYSCNIVDEEIRTDPAFFRLIISNLISNAVQYSDDSEEVVVRLSGAPDSMIEISNKIKGFDTSEIPNLTKRFWRADSARSSNHHCGLGLSIVDACAAKLGWEFNVEYNVECEVIKCSVGPMTLL